MTTTEYLLGVRSRCRAQVRALLGVRGRVSPAVPGASVPAPPPWEHALGPVRQEHVGVLSLRVRAAGGGRARRGRP